jgi:hypothetical protein
LLRKIPSPKVRCRFRPKRPNLHETTYILAWGNRVFGPARQVSLSPLTSRSFKTLGGQPSVASDSPCKQPSMSASARRDQPRAITCLSEPRPSTPRRCLAGTFRSLDPDGLCQKGCCRLSLLGLYGSGRAVMVIGNHPLKRSPSDRSGAVSFSKLIPDRFGVKPRSGGGAPLDARGPWAYMSLAHFPF